MQINSPRINFISTFLSQQFWAGFGSGRARWVRASLVSALSSCPPKLDVNKKLPFRKFWVRNISTKKLWPNYFPKNVISNSTINLFGINIDLISTATVFQFCRFVCLDCLGVSCLFACLCVFECVLVVHVFDWLLPALAWCVLFCFLSWRALLLLAFCCLTCFGGCLCSLVGFISLLVCVRFCSSSWCALLFVRFVFLSFWLCFFLGNDKLVRGVHVWRGPLNFMF